MKRIAAELKRAYASGAGRAVIALLLTTLCMGLTLALTRTTFLNNDDANIMYALAGYRTGTPYITHRFINVLLGRCISLLYSALPAVPWWSVYQLSMLFLSFAVITACLLKAGNRAGLPLWAPAALTALLYAAMFCYTATWIAFTLTAGMLGTAACALLLALDWERDGRAVRIRTGIGALLLLVMCFLTRNSSGYSMLCFFAAAGFYLLLKAPRAKRVPTVLFGVLSLVVIGAVVFVNGWGVQHCNPPEYSAFEAARGHFIDYPHAVYEDDPTFFEALGWDKTIYDLADNLCYLDPAVDAYSMQAASERSLGGKMGLGSRLLSAFAYGEAYFRGSGVSQYMLVIPVLLTLALAALFWHFRRVRRGKAELATGLATAAGAFLLCFYLCYKGRFPVRTFMLIAIPTAATEALLFINVWGVTNDWANCKRPCGEKTNKTGRILLIFGAAVSAVAIVWSVGMTAKTLRSYDKSALVEQNAAAEAYVMAHPENVYLTDVTNIENIGAFTVYPGQKPVNLVDWGGTGMHSGWKTEQLAMNGLLPFTGDVFRRENVYFITARDGDMLAMLHAYLALHFGARGVLAVEDVPNGAGLAVYRFEFAFEEGG